MVEALTATIRSDTASSIRLLENLTVQKLRLLTQLALARQMYPQISRQHRTPYAYTLSDQDMGELRKIHAGN